MKHILFFAGVFIVIVIILVSSPTGSEESTPDAFVIEDTSSNHGGNICCTFEQDGEVKTCAAVDGQLCDACLRFCGVLE